MQKKKLISPLAVRPMAKVNIHGHGQTETHGHDFYFGIAKPMAKLRNMAMSNQTMPLPNNDPWPWLVT